ncbi:MAG: DUF362 domain-containing protein [Candidatus Eisenbacteria bacterium]
MEAEGYRSMPPRFRVDRRSFLKVSGAVGAGLLLGNPTAWAEEKTSKERTKTNIDEALAVPKTPHSLPGPFPGRVVHVKDPQAIQEDKPCAEVLQAMFSRGIRTLTGADEKAAFDLLFAKDDVIGIKVNPVGPGLISTNHEVVDAILLWLAANGVPRDHVVIWDRFDSMLRDAGFTGERYPGVGIEGLQTMDEAAASGESEDDSRWLDEEGNHISASNFDPDVYYWADVEGPKEKQYLNQHVFSGKHSYFGKLLTKSLTKIINVSVFKNSGNGISMATKNIGYGAICNTGRLHNPLFFDVCTEVLAFPVVRDKMVLSVTDGLWGQYDGGPMSNAAARYAYNTLFFATDPFALDTVCHHIMVGKRKSMGIEVNENPRYTEYLRYAERLGLGVGDPERIKVIHA